MNINDEREREKNFPNLLMYYYQKDLLPFPGQWDLHVLYCYTNPTQSMTINRLTSVKNQFKAKNTFISRDSTEYEKKYMN